MRKILTGLTALTAVVALVGGCSDPTTDGDPTTGDTTASGGGGQSGASLDVTTLEAVPEIAALVPATLKERDVLRNGADTSYAPGEFLAEDGQTPIGYGVEIAEALARIMGLSRATTTTADLASIIPALGTKFDVSVSSQTITPSRLEQVNMVSYLSVGSVFAVAQGNPKGFDPADPCGHTIGVQTGSSQFDQVTTLNQECVAKGEPAMTVMPMDLQTDLSTKVIGGQFDVTVADTTVMAYTVRQSGGRLEIVGDEFDATDQGIAVAKSDPELTAAVQAGMQYLMDNGLLTQILTPYGAQDVALGTAELNPGTGD